MADTARNRQSGSVADRRRALTVLGDNPDGCTQAILLAHGFKSQLLAELVRTKLVTEHYERLMQGGRTFQTGSLRFHLVLRNEACVRTCSTISPASMIRFRSYRSNADGPRRRVSIGRGAVEVEVPDHIVAIAPVELLVCFKGRSA